jgi:hypothetical protein
MPMEMLRLIVHTRASMRPVHRRFSRSSAAGAGVLRPRRCRQYRPPPTRARNPRFYFVHTVTKPSFLTKKGREKSGIPCSAFYSQAESKCAITRPQNPRIPIVRFDIQTAFRARMSIFKSGISGSGDNELKLESAMPGSSRMHIFSRAKSVRSFLSVGTKQQMVLKT